jgi:hypothetical protein
MTNLPPAYLVSQPAYTADSGTPANADFCFIFPDRVENILNARARQLARTLSPNPNRQLAPGDVPDATLLQFRTEAGITEAEARELAEKWRPATARSIMKDYVRFIVVHEMCHGLMCGHHGPPGTEWIDPKGCIMRYLKTAEEWRYMINSVKNPSYTLKGTVYWNVCTTGKNNWAELQVTD